jgi:cytochrome P450
MRRTPTPPAHDPAAIDLTDLDLFEHGFPHDTFRWLRDEAPVFWHAPTRHTPDGEGFWVISRYADVLRVFLDPASFSSVGGGARVQGGTFLQDTPVAGLMLNMLDDPRHKRVRSLVNRGMTPRVIAQLEPDLRRRARAILDALGDGGERDLVADVSRDLPLQAICMLLGIPQEDRKQLCDCIDLAFDYSGRELGEQTHATRAATAHLIGYAGELIAERRRQPQDDMLSVVVHAALPDQTPSRLGDDELRNFFMLLFTAGSETTRKALAGGLFELSRHPEQLALLRAEPARIETAVEELVRWTSPSVYKRRTATREIETQGGTMRPGDKVTIWEASANRDERVFAEPFRFDVTRDPNPHLGFGQGAHYCLGANLARLEIRILLEELLPRLVSLEFMGPPVWTRDNRLFGLKRLPVRLALRDAAPD